MRFSFPRCHPTKSEEIGCRGAARSVLHDRDRSGLTKLFSASWHFSRGLTSRLCLLPSASGPPLASALEHDELVFLDGPRVAQGWGAHLEGPRESAPDDLRHRMRPRQFNVEHFAIPLGLVVVSRDHPKQMCVAIQLPIVPIPRNRGCFGQVQLGRDHVLRRSPSVGATRATWRRLPALRAQALTTSLTPREGAGSWQRRQ